ncbi:MAG: HNH endonuclease [Bacteroidetes bacterium]|nr:HNH endonuclease [Bacteroidota bacterium]
MPHRKNISLKLREKVAIRANHLCEYCKSPKSYSPSPFDVEHVFPISLGGNSLFENLAYSCNGHNPYNEPPEKSLTKISLK